MNDIMKLAKDFFKRVQDDEKSKEVTGMFRRTFQFIIKDGKPFVFEAKNGQFSFREGEVAKPDLLNEVTLVETDIQTLKDIMQGKVGPSEALDRGTLWMSSSMAAKVQNFWLLRLMRIGQGLH